MIANLLNGKKIANKIKKKIKKKLFFKNRRSPGLAIIYIGNNKNSEIYIRKKKEICEEIGINFFLFSLKKNCKKLEIISLIKDLNINSKIDGIVLQTPIESKYIKNVSKIFEEIHPSKDVDGLHPYNIGRLFQKSPILRPCTSYGIIQLLEHYKIKIPGLNAVIIGSSNIVGKPMALELLMQGATVTITHSLTKNLKKHVSSADLLIVAVGKPNFITSNWIKKYSIIIDVGINYTKNQKIVGDVKIDKFILNKASYITPVPGGVGPMTVIALVQNIMLSYQMHL
ncbi:bifunctional methylenetetrahydrofolate dehydrogenase/methenyltetrahydrofolate cyclohydrolase FolD [bacterium endosymbiont of Pedicinus badii]|uniref:bifunctional methylenetetrahydrofolate dehydrogenase/methenyltetrahydrofolate cyclohydrolase FolD n=1 Tax=bacterium endosymbiont of Pedicinus badii TaxID=1719126 RepID=UPI0009BBB516|nr:bifunctional methylenetetrahydrofolate dehydrogenase/methenyltetrahydrofolate cyclohydrolase FolD [bacterium endosymbiont of Pedicinus badii]OQM34301.1 methenyltetrahydrofolate cyclohydrolase [bacterium endosymbiont of Pedicinus badii]